MAKIKRVVEVDGEYVVMSDSDSLPIADGLANEYEACVVALLCSMGAFKNRRVFIAFNPNDSESGDDLIANEERFWWNGEEYQVGDDLNDPAERLLWYARYGYAQTLKDAGKEAPDAIWSPADAPTHNATVRWLIEVASDHEVHQFLPDEATKSRDEGANRSGDRYHISLLRDIVRDPSYHKLDESEKAGVLETLERLMQQSGLE
jgi:hypothetical protein